jgi:hypothetical protein
VIVSPQWFVEQITVEPYAGNGAYGDTYSEPVTVLGHVSGGRRANASEVVSVRQVLLPNPCHRADGSGTVDPSTLLTPESRVTSGAVKATVTKVAEHRQPGTGVVVYVSGDLG